MSLATLTSKGQITLPKLIREYLHLHAGSRIDFAVDISGKVTLTPIDLELKDIAGILKPKITTKITPEDMDKAILKFHKEQFEK